VVPGVFFPLGACFSERGNVRILACLVLLLSIAAAEAQIALEVQPRSFTVPATLTVTWNAPAPYTACTASGGWTGAKATSGSEQVAGVVGTTSFELTCTGSVPPVTVSWTNPTTNTDGSAYSNAKQIEVYEATSVAGLPAASAVIVPATQTSYQYTDLPVGVHHFGVKAVSLLNAKSALSGTPSVDVQAASGTATPVTVTGSAAPQPPSGVVSTSTTGYAVKANQILLDYELDGIVGTVVLGAPCDGNRQMGVTNYYAINRAKYVTWTTNRRPSTVVVECAAPPAGASMISEDAPIDEDYGK
jgi:hypothetical protein